MQTITVNLNVKRGSCRIVQPLYLGETVDITFDTEGSYSLILTEPFADSPKNGIAVWAQSIEGKLALTRKALHNAFKKADATQPNMTISAKVFVQDESGATVADGEVAIEYSPKAFVIDDEDYPLAREVLAQAEAAKNSAVSAKTAAEEAKLKAEGAQSAAEKAKDKAQSARNEAQEAKTGAEKALSAAKESAATSSAAKEGAITAQNASEAARTAAQNAQEAAEEARDDAETIASDTATKLVEASEKRLQDQILNKVDKEPFDALAQKVDAVVGGDTGKSARNIAAEEVAKVVANAPADFDTLKEIAAYIESDKTGAAQMVTQIDANAKAISTEVSRAKGAEAELDRRVTELEENGGGASVTVDDTLTQDGENPVKSKGIWSAIWGAIAAPAASVYAWVMTELGKKQDKLSEAQLAAANSGITAEKVGKLNGIEAGAQKNPDLSGYAKKTDIPAAPNLTPYAKTAEVLPRYPFVDAAIVDGVVTIAPYTNAKIASDGTAFSVAVVGESGYMRDCVLVADCTSLETAPTITWREEFHPRTDAETDFSCVARVRNVYWITEFAQGEFAVAGWQETTGGSAQ